MHIPNTMFSTRNNLPWFNTGLEKVFDTKKGDGEGSEIVKTAGWDYINNIL